MVTVVSNCCAGRHERDDGTARVTVVEMVMSSITLLTYNDPRTLVVKPYNYHHHFSDCNEL